MADSTSLNPAELDRLEDALESLELGELASDLPDEVRSRLEDYREILAMSREVLPMQDVPEGLLAAVFAEARGEAGATDTQEHGVVGSAVESGVHPRGLWHRLRRTLLVPAVGLVGSAAAVLWMISPDVGELGQTTTVAEAPAAGVPAPPAAGPASPSAQADDQLQRAKFEADGNDAPAAEAGLPEGEVEAAAEARPEPTQKRQIVTPDEPSRSAAKGKSAASKGDLGDPFDDKAPAPKSKPAPEPNPQQSSPAAPGGSGPGATWTQIADADTKRRANRCGLAQIIYRNAIKTSDSRIAARGHAGLGLCAESNGDDPSAYFARARKLDSGIDSFIADERSRAYRPGSKASKKKAAPPDADNASESAETY